MSARDSASASPSSRSVRTAAFISGWRQLHVAQRIDHFQHFAASREHPAALPLVVVERVHEFDFLIGVIAFAGGRIDLAAAIHFLPALERAGPRAMLSRPTPARRRGAPAASAINRDCLVTGVRLRVRATAFFIEREEVFRLPVVFVAVLC